MFNVVSFVRALPLCAAFSIGGLSSCGGSTHTPGDGQYAASVEPGTRAPADAIETRVLALLAEADTTRATQDNTATIGASYTAASGRLCKQVLFPASPGRTALVCQMDSGWRFVPDIFIGEHAKR